VELNQKFEDMISELKDAEDSLKQLSSRSDLNQNLNPEEFRNCSRVRAITTRTPSRSRMSGRSLTST